MSSAITQSTIQGATRAPESQQRPTELGGRSPDARSLGDLSLEEKKALLKRLMREKAAAGSTTITSAAEPSAPLPRPFELLSGEDRAALGSGIEDAWPLTRLQAGMLFHSELQEGEAVYHDLHSVHLRGPFDRAALEATVRRVVDRHPVLRTSFEVERFSEPLQVVHSQVELPLLVEDLRPLDDDAQERHIEDWLAAERCRPFDSTQAPMFVFVLHRRAEDRFQFTLSFHHAVLDGWSAANLLAELFVRYQAALTRSSSPSDSSAPGSANAAESPLASSYGDFVALERQALDSTDSQEFWRQTLADCQRIELPRRCHPPRISDPQQPQAASRALVLDVPVAREVGERLQAEARQLAVPIKTLLLAVHLRVLSALSGQRDVLSGVVVNGRPERLDGEKVLGVFLNTPPLRLELERGSWRQLVRQVFEAENALWPHRRLPLVELQKRQGGEPLFEVLFNFMHYHVYRGLARLGGMEVLGRHSYEETNLPLLVNFYQHPESSRVGLALNWPSTVFARSEVEGFAAMYRRALEALALDPAADHHQLTLLSVEEERQILVGWNDTATDYGTPRPLHRAIAEQVRRTPAAPAVIFEDEVTTYAELAAAAHRLARHLRALGVGPEVPVGVCLERSSELLVALLAILEAGGAYVPLDPSYPAERLALMLDDSKAQLVVSRESESAVLPEAGARRVLLDRDAEVIANCSDEPLAPSGGIDNLAYVIYTSGSTGRPKGVMNSHRGIWNRLAWMQAAYGLGADDRVLQKTPMSFDVSVWEFFWPLMTGATLVVARPEGHRDPRYLAETLEHEGITTLHFVPSMLRAFLEERVPLEEGGLPPFPGLRRVITSGEALPRDLVDQFHGQLFGGDRGAELHNLYGPTEAAVDVTSWPCERGETGGVPIGRPIANLRVHVLGPDLVTLAPGVPGELLLGGVGVARGYHCRPALTAERFVPDPTGHEPGGRLYRTGDLCRHRHDGVVEFLGRLDHQVKIRGVRIELGEIEAALLDHPAVREAVVMPWGEGGATQLVAWVVCDVADAEDGPSVSTLRDFLRRSLTEPMVPARMVFVDELPLSPNGKLDRRALPAPELDRSGADTPYEAPRTEHERLLADIWADVLGVERVGLHDNFFDLGGDSILSLRLRARATRVGIPFSLPELFEHRSIAGLLAQGSNEGAETTEPTEPWALVGEADRRRMGAMVEDAYPLARLQGGMLFHGAYRQGVATYHDVVSHQLRAPFDRAALASALDDVMRRHAVLRTGFDLESFDQPLQVVHRSPSRLLTVEDLSDLDVAAQEDAIQDFIAAEKHRPYELSRPPLFRVTIHRRSDEGFQFSFSFHHAILDGWSVASLLAELFRGYLGRVRGETIEGREPLPLAYRDFVAAELAALDCEETREFWRHQVAGRSMVALPRWRTAAELGAQRPKRGRNFEVGLGTETTAGLEAMARRLGVPLKSVLLAAHLRVLGALGNVGSPCSGLVVNGRPEDEGGEAVLGLFLNTVPLAIDLGAASWDELVRRTFEAETALLRHRRFPLAKILDLAAEPPIFEVVFNYVHFHAYQGLAQLEGVEVVDGSHFEETNYTLTVHFQLASASGGLKLDLAYDEAELGRPEVAALAGYFERVFEAMLTTPGLDHRTTPLLAPAPRRQMLVEWNAPQESAGEAVLAAWLDGEETLHRLIARQVARTPDATAVVLDDPDLVDPEGHTPQGLAVLSYAELDRRANRLAHHLLGLGLAPEGRVGIALERSLDLMVALLATLKAGGAYVPLDPSYPEERLRAILEDARPTLVLTRGEIADRLPASGDGMEIPRVRLDEDPARHELDHDPAVAVDPEQLAYVIFTSGSTGRPKGAMNSHRAIVNRLAWKQATYGLGADDRVLQKTPISFDVSVWELFWPLLTGAPLVLARPGGHQDSRYLSGVIQRHAVTTLHFVPSMLRAFVAEPETERCGSLRRVIASGEALPFELQQRFFARLPGCQLHNLYGPTEAAVDVTSWACRPDDPSGVVPIGRPITNLRVHLLGRDLEPTPLGTPGELHIGGIGLARGYLDRPARTAAVFVPDPHSEVPGARLYRTGDSVRRLTDGSLLFLDRLDHQVKIRGFRIELGEIEAALERHPHLAEAVVLARTTPGAGDGRQLVAYLVKTAGEATPTVGNLRRWLLDIVPEYMVPAAFVFLDTLPTTPNGKLDRRALPEPQAERPTLDQVYVAPRNPREKALAAVWAEVLGVERPGVHDNFFELGGDSILSLQVVARAGRGTEGGDRIRLTPELIFEHPTIAQLAELDLDEGVEAEQGVVVGDVPLTPIQGWLLDDPPTDFHHWNQALLLEVHRPADTAAITPEACGRAMARLLEHHDALRLRLQRDDGTEGEAPTWRQHSAEPGGTATHGTESIGPCEAIDLSALTPEERGPAIREAADRLQRSLDLEHGPWLRCGFFDLGADEPPRLLLVVHHLAVDGVSWRILLEDLWALLRQDLEGVESVVLPPKTTSFKAWSEALAERAASDALADEASYWLRQVDGELPRLPTTALPSDRAAERGEATVATNDTVHVALDPERTEALLSEVHGAYKTRIDDLLLTALARAFGDWTGREALWLDLEGHGRDAVAGLDVSRTVGWFTTLYPVLLRPEGDAPGKALVSVKEQLRQVPGGGEGFGLLRQSSPDPEVRHRLRRAPRPEVCFNYLGQLDRALPAEAPFRPARESAGDPRSPRGANRWALEVVASLSEGRLRSRWTYSRQLHQRQTLETLAAAFLAELETLIDHCLDPEAGALTASEFPLAELDQNELEGFLDAIDLDAL